MPSQGLHFPASLSASAAFFVLDDTNPNRTSSDEVLIAVCTYQEVDNIRAMLFGLRESFPTATLMVVDDNSPDGTADVVRELQQSDSGIQLVVRKGQRGLGSAIVDSMKFSVAEGYRYFLNLDADLSHDPNQLPSLLERARTSTEIDVVIGSRYIEGGKIVGWPLRRRIMSKLVNRFATAFLKLPVKDCSGSMRCYRTSALDALDLNSLQCTGYAVLEELLVKMDRNGCAMDEVPITFTERELGHSKLTMAEAFRSVSFMIRLAFTVGR